MSNDKDNKKSENLKAENINIARAGAQTYAEETDSKGLNPKDSSDAPKREAPKKYEAENVHYMSALAQAYAKALEARGLKPGDVTNIQAENKPDEETAKAAAKAMALIQGKKEEEAEKPVEAGAEAELKVAETAVTEPEPPETAEETEAELKGIAPAVIDLDDQETQERNDAEEKAAAAALADAKKKALTAEEEQPEEPKDKKKTVKGRKALKLKRGPYEKSFKGLSLLSKTIELGDKVQEKVDDVATGMGKDFIIASHNIASTYRNTRRSIGLGLLAITIIVSGILILFDRFTVYEYAYNGKVLGYVREQEEVTDVLDIAGKKLSENSSSNLDVEFVANQNVTFNEVDSSGKVLDTSDAAVNKLVYMTDIETEAYGVYDGQNLVAIVKDNNDAETLLKETQTELSTPDRGMKLVSTEFANTLDIKPLNVLLTSVQDNTSAREQMISGGEMQIYHIVEEGENAASLQSDFSVSAENIFDESNTEVVAEPEQGDKICIHKTVDPLSVTMVENGRMKEVVEYKTIKKESDEYYKGDTFIKQEGRDGIQIFEGTITKQSGEIVKREGEVVDETRKVQNKIILVGTAERPKTAATGTFAIPCERYTLTSGFGPRWGRAHTGLDMAAPIGTPIYASDGGTVITSGYSGAYGMCIDIDHGNGYVTKYGHCSKLLVNVGEKVYQGQQIALMGSTGRSTGSHLHFEIIQNGSRIDPEPKLGI